MRRPTCKEHERGSSGFDPEEPVGSDGFVAMCCSTNFAVRETVIDEASSNTWSLPTRLRLQTIAGENIGGSTAHQIRVPGDWLAGRAAIFRGYL
jgi:hypothetical protein